MNTILLILCLLAMVVTCNAVCCGFDVSDGGLCGGVGKCNLLCCNCDGGCKRDQEKRLAGNNEQTVKETFALIDKDHDGFVTFDEVLKYVLPSNGKDSDITKVHAYFNVLDKNGDGKINLAEFEKVAELK